MHRLKKCQTYGNFSQVPRYKTRVVIYDRGAFLRLAKACWRFLFDYAPPSPSVLVSSKGWELDWKLLNRVTSQQSNVIQIRTKSQNFHFLWVWQTCIKWTNYRGRHSPVDQNEPTIPRVQLPTEHIINNVLFLFIYFFVISLFFSNQY